MWLAGGATAIYGGYFGTAQGILPIGILGPKIADQLQRLNGLKDVLALFINGVAAVLFILRAPVAWLPAVLIAVSSTVDGQICAGVGRRLRRRSCVASSWWRGSRWP